MNTLKKMDFGKFFQYKTRRKSMLKKSVFFSYLKNNKGILLKLIIVFVLRDCNWNNFCK